jgi:hypothetical protein
VSCGFVSTTRLSRQFQLEKITERLKHFIGGSWKHAVCQIEVLPTPAYIPHPSTRASSLRLLSSRITISAHTAPQPPHLSDQQLDDQRNQRQHVNICSTFGSISVDVNNSGWAAGHGAPLPCGCGWTEQQCTPHLVPALEAGVDASQVYHRDALQLQRCALSPGLAQNCACVHARSRDCCACCAPVEWWTVMCAAAGMRLLGCDCDALQSRPWPCTALTHLRCMVSYALRVSGTSHRA